MMKFRFNKTSGFLEKSSVRDYRPHTGSDYSMPEGTQLRSLGDGVVENITDPSSSLGNGVFIKLENGETLVYGHMNKVSVEVGDTVSMGQKIGLSGNTGNSTGPHLHFAVQNSNGDYTNPNKYEVALQSLTGVDTPTFTDSSHLFEMMYKYAAQMPNMADSADRFVDAYLNYGGWILW